ncbi:uncharacterized protein PV09_05665 [Verruconis gallopava]|uniref:Uncharacterized protein n=1 Tax=Verruconis gallopava TaxID=253628 RepID=A0A0D1YR44_9PEZI|nr:uncharacterized protein PV09_05665 [Verruconis gallopava]KIW03007.1 hypothetical protein PV09_05665 [Verruconis gallopava]
MSFNSSFSFAQSAHTLPRNFTFHYRDGELPKTPEPSDKFSPLRTSPPPIPVARVAREPYRLRRRRAPVQAAQRAIRAIHHDDVADVMRESQDVPVPSIELTDSAGAPAIFPEAPASKSRLFSPPRTPVAQIYNSEDTYGEASSSQEDLTRPSTACSGFSESSKSSSVESFPSFGESCSPKSQHDPFSTGAPAFGIISSPLQKYCPPPAANTLPSTKRAAWTQEMDDHLWITYMRYLQDPTHTPFKMLPGTAPPPGVCSRVVREAKRTWKGHLTSSVPKVYRFARWGSNRAESPEANNARDVERPSFMPWPRSDSATRKRLRDLCRLKPTLSAHYGRLLHARSPSPFLTSSTGPRSTSVTRDGSSPHLNTGAFSTRDMNVSLATSISTTMQLSHPLAQLSSDATPTQGGTIPHINHPQETSTPRPRATTHHDISAAPRTPIHQKSLSMQEASLSMHPRPLASPFRPIPTKAKAHEPLQSAMASSSSMLGAPVELHAPVPRRSLFKRPAQTELNDMMHSEDPYTRQHHLMKELFGSNQPIEVSHRRVRSRGFSLGDMTAASRLESLFASPNESALATESSVPATSRSFTHSLLPPPSFEARLGSPFSEKPATKTHYNTFPRNFSLIGLEPAMDIVEDPSDTLTAESVTGNT